MGRSPSGQRKRVDDGKQLLDGTRIVEGIMVFLVENDSVENTSNGSLGRVIFSLRELPEGVMFQTLHGCKICRISDIEVTIDGNYKPIPRNHPPALATAPPADRYASIAGDSSTDVESVTQSVSVFSCSQSSVTIESKSWDIQTETTPGDVVMSPHDLKDDIREDENKSQKWTFAKKKSFERTYTGDIGKKPIPPKEEDPKESTEQKKKKKGFGQFLRRSLESPKKSQKKKKEKRCDLRASSSSERVVEQDHITLGRYERTISPIGSPDSFSGMSHYPALSTRQRENVNNLKNAL